VYEDLLQAGGFLDFCHDRSNLHKVWSGAHKVQYFHGNMPWHIVFRSEDWRFRMLQMAVALVVLLTQLSGPGGELPQILHPEYKMAPVTAGNKTDLTPVSGLTIDKMDFSTPSPDPKSKDEYYVTLPTIKVSVGAAKAGSYEIPGKLRYFFCSKSDGFCSVQTLDVKIPVNVQ
jgi:hypothetical protein